MTSRITSLTWTDSLDAIVTGDHAVMLAYPTPANGVVLAPVSNFDLHDRDAGVVTVNTSVGAWKKLDRIRRNPHVALVYHTRAHANHAQPEYVLVQGTASLMPAVADYPSTVVDAWERFEPWRDVARIWKRWQRIYALRVEVRIQIERIVAWPDLACAGQASVYGPSLPDDPPVSQSPPRNGTEPRHSARRAARQAARQPDVLLGWIATDGFPMVVPAGIAGADNAGIRLDTQDGLVPPGARRAGLTAHRFSRGVVGQRQLIFTGWLELPASGGAAVYAPHTRAAYWMPPVRTIYRIAVGAATRSRYRKARKAGADFG